MDSLNFEGFHAQLDCKFTYGNKNQTQLTLVQYIQFRVQEKKIQKETVKNSNDEKYNQTCVSKGNSMTCNGIW